MKPHSRILHAAEEVRSVLPEEAGKRVKIAPFDKLLRLLKRSVVLQPEEQKGVEKILEETRQRMHSTFINSWTKDVENELRESRAHEQGSLVEKAIYRCKTEEDIVHFCAQYMEMLTKIPELARQHFKAMHLVPAEVRKEDTKLFRLKLESIIIQNVLHQMKVHQLNKNLRDIWIKVLEDHYPDAIARLQKSYPADEKLKALQVRPRKPGKEKRKMPATIAYV